MKPDIRQAIEDIMEKYSHDENFSGGPHSHGAKNQRDRLSEVAMASCNAYGAAPIIEIGAHKGLTTKRFIEIAKLVDTDVIVIDPWNGKQEGNESVYQQFLENTKDHDGHLQVYRLESQSDEAKAIIQSIERYSFAWVDGLHTFGASKQDIESLKDNCPVIAVDDLKWCGEVEKAFNIVEGFTKLRHANCREGYLVQ